MRKGSHLTNETKKKISLTLKGRVHSEEEKQKISLGLKLAYEAGRMRGMSGKNHSLGWRKKMSRIMSEKWASGKFVRQYTEDSKREMSEAGMGRIPWNKGLTKNTDVRLRKLSEQRKGMKFSKEHRQNLSVSHIGKKPSDASINRTKETTERMLADGTHPFLRDKVINADLTRLRWKDLKFRERMSEVFSKSHKGKRPTKEQNVKNALIHAFMIKNNKGNFGPHKGIMFRSEMELLVAKNLDALRESWDYEPEFFILKNGWTYTPDFKVSFGWIEVKGFYSERAIEKMNLFVEAGNNLFIVDERNVNDPQLYDAIPWSVMR
jgi:hypothetical protein